MTNTNSTVLKVMNVLFWIACIGLCIKTGALMTSFLVSLLVNPEAAKDLYLGLNLFDLYAFSQPNYIFIVSSLIVVTGLKAQIAAYVIKGFGRFNLSKPFEKPLADLFTKISHVALGTGVLAMIAHQYCKWISKKGPAIPIDWGGNEILFFAGVIYLFALIFEKGTALQTENDLTV
jgi:hypothetical protein